MTSEKTKLLYDNWLQENAEYLSRLKQKLESPECQPVLRALGEALVKRSKQGNPEVRLDPCLGVGAEDDEQQ